MGWLMFTLLAPKEISPQQFQWRRDHSFREKQRIINWLTREDSSQGGRGKQTTMAFIHRELWHLNTTNRDLDFGCCCYLITQQICQKLWQCYCGECVKHQSNGTNINPYFAASRIEGMGTKCKPAKIFRFCFDFFSNTSRWFIFFKYIQHPGNYVYDLLCLLRLSKHTIAQVPLKQYFQYQ